MLNNINIYQKINLYISVKLVLRKRSKKNKKSLYPFKESKVTPTVYLVSSRADVNVWST